MRDAIVLIKNTDGLIHTINSEYGDRDPSYAVLYQNDGNILCINIKLDEEELSYFVLKFSASIVENNGEKIITTFFKVKSEFDKLL